MGGDGVSSTDSPLPSVQANTKTDIKTGARKTLESSYKPQPPKPHRVSSIVAIVPRRIIDITSLHF